MILIKYRFLRDRARKQPSGCTGCTRLSPNHKITGDTNSPETHPWINKYSGRMDGRIDGQHNGWMTIDQQMIDE